MADISSNSGLGFYAQLSGDSLDADDLDQKPSLVVSGTNTVSPVEIYLTADINGDGTQTLTCNVRYSAFKESTPTTPSKRWYTKIDTDQLTESTLLAMWNDVISFGHIDETLRSPSYTDSSKGVSDFS